MRRTSRLVFILIYLCFFVQWYLLSLVLKNLRILAPNRLQLFATNYKTFGTLFLVSVICLFASVGITNNWILPEDAENETTFIPTYMCLTLLALLYL